MDLCCLQSPHPSVLLGPVKRGRESQVKRLRGRESWDLWPVGDIWESTKPLEQHTSPQIPYTPPPDAPLSLFFSESLSLFSLPAHSLMERGFSKSTKWLERSWTDWSLKGLLSKSTAQITASQLSTASEDCHYCKILNTIYFLRTFCLETSFTDGWEKYLLDCFKNTISWLVFADFVQLDSNVQWFFCCILQLLFYLA